MFYILLRVLPRLCHHLHVGTKSRCDLVTINPTFLSALSESFKTHNLPWKSQMAIHYIQSICCLNSYFA